MRAGLIDRLAVDAGDDRQGPVDLFGMDTAGIDVSVLTVNIPGPELLTPELGIEGARICNDYLAELCERHRGRFVGVATLPLQDVPAAMTEYRRAIFDLGLRGIFLFSLQRLREHEGRPVERELQMGVFDDLSARLRAALAVGWWVGQEAMLGGVEGA